MPKTLHEGSRQLVTSCSTSYKVYSRTSSLNAIKSEFLMRDFDRLRVWKGKLNKVHVSFAEDLEFVERQWIIELFRLGNEREEDIRTTAEECDMM